MELDIVLWLNTYMSKVHLFDTYIYIFIEIWWVTEDGNQRVEHALLRYVSPFFYYYVCLSIA